MVIDDSFETVLQYHLSYAGQYAQIEPRNPRFLLQHKLGLVK
jgi:hypothetical protein